MIELISKTGFDPLTLVSVILTLLKSLGLCNPDKPPTDANRALQAKEFATKQCIDSDPNNLTFSPSSIKTVSIRVKKSIDKKERKANNYGPEYYERQAIEILKHTYITPVEILEQEITNARNNKVL